MPESFTLNFDYKGIPREINCTLRVSSYTYQFLCTIDQKEWVLERDDGGSLRALDPDPFSDKKQKTDPGLMVALIEEMERVLH